MNWFNGSMVRWFDGSIIRWFFAIAPSHHRTIALFCFLLLSSCASEDIFPSIGASLSNPVSIAIDSAANRAYLINSNSKFYYETGSLQILDISAPAAPALLNTVEIPNFSGQAYPSGGYLYLTNRLSSDNSDTSDSLLRINVDEASASFLTIDAYTAGNNPFGVAYDAVSTNLYVATLGDQLDYYPIAAPSRSSITLAPLDLSDGTAVTDVDIREVVIIGRQAFVTRPRDGLLIIDLDENNVDYYISDIFSPRGIATDGVNLFIASIDTSTTALTPHLYVINPASLTALAGNTTATLVDKDDSGLVVADVEAGTDPQEVAVSTNYIFVSNMGADSVSVINRADYSKESDITVGDEPFGMNVYPAGAETHLFVTNIQSNSVSIIDIATLAVVATY
jgi:YVTN family beta-propeller protein